MNASSILVMLPFLAGLFLFGLLLAKERVLEAPSQHPRTRCWMLGIGTAALVLSIAIGLAFDSKNGFAFSTAVEFCFGPLLSLGLIMLLAMASESRVLPAIQSAMAKVGRTAFSCYILQSLLGTAIFYSWGGGLFGKLDRLQMLAFVPIIWAADILFAHIWLKRYRMGPLEWAWRSLTEGRRLQNLVSR